MKYDIFLFDADDTLFDFYNTGKKSFLKACRDKGVPAVETDYDIYSDINQKRWDLFSKGLIDKRSVVIGRFDEYKTVKNVDFDSEEFYEEYEKNLSETCILFPETVEVLTRLKSKGVRNYIITNGLKTVQRNRLAISGLYPLLDGVFISDEMGVTKPQKEYYDLVEKGIPNFYKEKTLIVGDSLVSDIPLGNNNGIDTCLINRSGKKIESEVPYTYEIKNLKELYKFVE